MKNNIIHRNSKYIIIEYLIDTNYTKKGDKAYLKRNELKGNFSDICRNLYVFSSMIRNPEVCKIVDQW